MLTLNPETATYALDSDGTPFREHIGVGDCCLPYQPEPSIRMGTPHNPDQYLQEGIDGVTGYIPHCLTRVPLVGQLSSFMGFKRLVVDGWRQC